MQIYLYGELKTNVEIIYYSEQRFIYLYDINFQINTMTLISSTMNQRIANPKLPTAFYTLYANNNTLQENFTTAEAKLNAEATNLKNVQTQLSLQSTSLSNSALTVINPNNVVLTNMPVFGMPLNYSYTNWQAVMEIVISSYRIASMNITQVDDSTDPTVYFVCQNSLNNIIINLQESTNGIINETENTRQLNITIFVVLLCVSSFFLAISTILLVPVINKVKKYKQEVFELFMHIKKTQAITEQMKCSKFLSSFRENPESENITPDQEQELEEEQKEAEHNKPGLDDSHIQTLRRKFKNLAPDLVYVIFKFIFLILLMEGYFIMIYFLSTSFLSQFSSLTQELNMLLSRLPTHSQLLLIEK